MSFILTPSGNCSFCWEFDLIKNKFGFTVCNLLLLTSFKFDLTLYEFGLTSNEFELKSYKFDLTSYEYDVMRDEFELQMV